ncbi:uncharacterized protein [Nicotiana tomentosiformis]|uniref:uncharacterized protein n=1 Tax=Nicotiana tomentosiformis TaxID=4098 RepID=UPI00388CA283
MAIKIVVGGYTLNVVSVYAPHVGLNEEVKRRFWEDLDGLVRGIPSTDKLIIGGDFNNHIGMLSSGMTVCMVASILEVEMDEMVRTCATGSAEKTPTHSARASRDRGRGRVAVEEPPLAPIGGQAPETHVVNPKLQETLVQFLNMFEQRVYIVQVSSVLPVQPVIPVQPEVRPKASEEEQKRLERFKTYSPPTFSDTTAEDAQEFLEKCHRILRTMGIVEVSEIAFNIFQLSGEAYQWWQVYEEGRPVDAVPPTWAQFVEIFLEEFVPQALRDAWRIEFKRLRQGTITVSEYAIRLSELARRAPILVPTVRERVHIFIEGLDYDLKICMAREF